MQVVCEAIKYILLPEIPIIAQYFQMSTVSTGRLAWTRGYTDPHALCSFSHQTSFIYTAPLHSLYSERHPRWKTCLICNHTLSGNVRADISICIPILI